MLCGVSTENLKQQVGGSIYHGAPPPRPAYLLCTLLEINYCYQPTEKSTPWRRDIGKTNEPLPPDFGHKALPILENTYHGHRFHVHCYCGRLQAYQRWVGVFPNSVFGQVLAAGLGELA